MRYLTHYQEYPIFEPAEGGYYYAGNEMVETKRLSKRKAKEEMDEIWAQCEAENAENEAWKQRTGQRFDYWCRSNDGNKIWKSTRYIGDGESYVIERRPGKDESGWQPYC